MSTPSPNAAGHPERDPESLRAGQELVRQSLVELQAVYDHAPVGLCVLDTELRWVRINHRLAEINGFAPEAHLGRRVRELLPGIADHAEPVLRRVLETGEPIVGIELHGETPAQPGARRVWRENLYPLFDDERRLIGINIVCQEITDQRRRQRCMEILAQAGMALTASFDVAEVLAAALRLLVPDVATLAMVDLAVRGDELSSDLHVACADASAEEILRDDRRTSLDAEHAIRDAHRARRSRVVHGLAAVLSGVAGHAGSRSRLDPLGLQSAILAPIMARGSSLGVLTLATSERRYDDADLALAEELGRRIGVAVENARLFEMAQAERRRAEEANRSKDEFLSVISHELRTPLTAMLGWAAMLRTRNLPPEAQARGLETIERNARVQTQLIEDLLDITRITTGRLRLSVAPVDLARVLEAASDGVRPAAEARGVHLRRAFGAGVGPVMGDAERLQQVAWNLLANAVKFTERGGEVRVALRAADPAVEILVEDTGRGIDPAFLLHIFEPFRQSDASTTRIHGGLGLGLAIVKHLVELHGGMITAHSDGPGRGATFAVRLPAAQRAAASPATRPPAAATDPSTRSLPAPPGVEGLRVLVVDDDADARELLASVLGAYRMEVACASSAAEALCLLPSLRPDVLVSDIGMPGEDGFQLIERVRALPAEQGGRTPAVALTAYARVEDRTRALLSGFDMHLTKPVEPNELIVTVATVAGSRAGRA